MSCEAKKEEKNATPDLPTVVELVRLSKKDLVDKVIGLSKINAELSFKNQELTKELEECKQANDSLKQQLFGTKSEKKQVIIDQTKPQQAQFTFSGLEDFLPPPTNPEEYVEVPAHLRPKRQTYHRESVEGILAHSSLPVEEITVLPREIEGLSPDDYVTLRERIKVVIVSQSTSKKIIKYTVPVIKLKPSAFQKNPALNPESENEATTSEPVVGLPQQAVVQAPDKEDNTTQEFSALAIQEAAKNRMQITTSIIKILSAEVPGLLSPRACYDISFAVEVALNKLSLYQPLYRQHQYSTLNGIDLSASILAGSFSQCAGLLKPLHVVLGDWIKSSGAILMDETIIKCERNKPKHKMKTGYFWIIRTLDGSMIFYYRNSREHKHVEEILGDYRGTLTTDDYQAYINYAKEHIYVVHALCWTHSRRKFVSCYDLDIPFNQVIIDLYGELYKIEAEIKKQGLVDQAKKAYRQEYSKPVVDKIFEILKSVTEGGRYLPKSKVAKAIRYALDNEKEMRQFLEYPQIPLDTNELESGLRPVPMGRKNYLFCTSTEGAEDIAILQSFIETCKAYEINPRTYLIDVLSRLTSFKHYKPSDLLPHRWKELYGNAPIKAPWESVGPDNTIYN